MVSSLFHLSLFCPHFHSNFRDVALGGIKSLKNWQRDIFTHSQRSRITEIASEANVSPAPANLNVGGTSADVDPLLLFPPQFLPPHRTLRWTWRCRGWLGKSTRSGASLRTPSPRAKSRFIKVSHPFHRAKGGGAGQLGGLEAGTNGPSVRNLKSWPVGRSQPEYINSGTLRRSG